jgi:dihydrofolate reductase
MDRVKVTLWMATSLNAMAAREDQSEDFLSQNDWELFVELLGSAESLVWGRVTHELFIDPVRALVPDLPIAVLTRDQEWSVDAASVVAGSPEDALAKLAAQGAGTALLAGGPHVNGAFAAARLIDEVILGVEPVLVSRGIPLLVGDAADLRLDLVNVDDRRRPTLRLHYRVLPATS